MNLRQSLKKFWEFLKKDTWQSWLVSIILIIAIIKLLLFPTLSLVTGTSLPLVVVESCSMYHQASFDGWWTQNSAWYEARKIEKENFESYPMKNGLNKGDIVFVWGKGNYSVGDIIIFNSEVRYPIIHRIVSISPVSTKGDNNPTQIDIEKGIMQNQITGKAVFRIPSLGWIKLIFYEPFRESGKGFCN